jgi:uncharacterized protein YjbI with pentapeptide repeats
MSDQELRPRSPSCEEVLSWNLWRQKNRTVLPFVPHYFKAGLRLDGIDFSHLDMEGVLFDEISLNRACFDGTNLKGAKFNKCAMDHASFHETILQDSEILNCTIERSQFYACNMTNIVLSFSNMTDSQLSKVQLRRGNLEQSNIAASSICEVDFRNARLGGTGFINSRISNSQFVEAKATAADFSGVHMARCQFESSDLSEVSFHNSKFANCRISRCKIIGADFSGAQFHQCVINDIDFSRALQTDRMQIVDSRTNDSNQIQKNPTCSGLKYFRTCFLSYSWLDNEFVEQLSCTLSEFGVSIYLDKNEMSSTEWIETSLQKAIKSHEVLVLVLSENSEGRDWVKFEIEFARTIGIEVIPVVIDNPIGEKQWVKDIISAHKTIDFTQWRNENRFSMSRDLLLEHLTKSQRTQLL